MAGAWWAAYGVSLALLIDPGAREILAFWPGVVTPGCYAGASALPLESLLPGLAVTAEQISASMAPMPGSQDAD